MEIKIKVKIKILNYPTKFTNPTNSANQHTKKAKNRILPLRPEKEVLTYAH